MESLRCFFLIVTIQSIGGTLIYWGENPDYWVRESWRVDFRVRIVALGSDEGKKGKAAKRSI